MHDDLAIARRLLAGDEKTFREVFDGFFPRLYRYALTRVDGDGEEARDIVQQTFCKAFERLDTYRAEASLYGWMLQICRNLLIDNARRRSTRPQPLHSAGAHDLIQALVDSLRAPAADEPEQALVRLSLLELIRSTLDYLPSHYGDVLEWKYIEERSVKDIAAELHIEPKAAESLLTRARRAFREAIVAIDESADLLPRGLVSTIER